jgi:hypothetical protein
MRAAFDITTFICVVAINPSSPSVSGCNEIRKEVGIRVGTALRW